MLAPLTGPTPAQWHASFDKALGKFAQRNAPIPYSRTCRICSKPIFSADTAAYSAQDSNGKTVWMHFDCWNVAQSENVISGAETPDGTSDTQDNQPRNEE